MTSSDREYYTTAVAFGGLMKTENTMTKLTVSGPRNSGTEKSERQIQTPAKVGLKTLLASSFVSALLLTACNPSKTNSQKQLVKLNSIGTSIVHGQPVDASDPIAASTVVLYLATQEGLVNFCTGSLIDSDVVLTAGHCIADFAEEIGVPQEEVIHYIGVGFGPKIVKSLEDESLSLIAVKAAKVHPDYKVGSVQNALDEPMKDVALLKLESPAPKGFTAVKLNSDASLVQKGDVLILAGFGLVDGVKKTNAVGLNKVDVTVTEPDLTATQFSYETVDGKTACGGDSGGPAFRQNAEGAFVLVGVTSWGDNQCKKFGTYTKVSAIYDFVSTASWAK